MTKWNGNLVVCQSEKKTFETRHEGIKKFKKKL